MARCERLDYTYRDDSLVPLVEYHQVTQGSMATLGESVYPEHLAEIEEGDEIAVYRIENRVEAISGTLIIWYNKEMACINIGNGNAWGDWDEEAELVISEEFAEARDEDGLVLAGRIAYNTHGIRGIYKYGIFHTLVKEAHA